jgi:CheY-like chemotaxis protein
MTDCPVLVVDDDSSILETISEALSLEGYDVATAANGAEALEVFASVRPHVVLLDMRMPVLDGWGFARELKSRGLAAHVIVMTAAQDARAWADQIGAAAFLAKPFELLDLLDHVERFCTQGGEAIAPRPV